MIHLNVLVEGSTELRFVKAVLAPSLGMRNIYAYPIAVLTSKDKRASTEYRGGIISYQQVKADLLRLIRRDQSKPNVWFTTMIDLYHLPEDFPSSQGAKSIPDHITGGAERPRPQERASTCLPSHHGGP